MDTLREIERWYAAQCDGDWEHTYGVQIDTLDNPGWRVWVDLRGTALEGRPFDAVRHGDPEHEDPMGGDWLHLHVADARFEGTGDPSKLDEILRAFLTWAGSHAPA